MRSWTITRGSTGLERARRRRQRDERAEWLLIICMVGAFFYLIDLAGWLR